MTSGLAPAGRAGLRRRAIASAIAIVVGAAALFLAVAGAFSPAWALVLTVSPTAAVGITNNVTNLPTTQPKTSVFGALTGAAQLELTRATSVHRVGYTVRTIQYADGTAGNTSQSALVFSQFSLSAQLTLTVGADASIYAVSSIPTVAQATATVTPPAGAATSARLVNTDVTQTLTYQPDAGERYAQSLLASYADTLGGTRVVPRTLRVDGGLRGESLRGANSYSLNLLGEEFRRLDPAQPVPGITTTSTTAGVDQAVSVQALLGWRRDLTVATNAGVEVGPMVVFGFPGGPQWVPGVIASAGYRSMPWYWTGTLSQQPLVNPFLGQLLIADAASLRLSLPLDAREAWVATGFGGYTYGRAVTPTHDLVLSARVYQLVQGGASLAYQFQRLPFFVSLDYLETWQDGAVAVGLASSTSHRRVLSVTFGGNFAWGEGNHGVPLRTPSAHP